MPVYRWSITSAANGTADPSAPFPEGMSPSAVDDGARGLMAAVAQYRDDIAGAIVTTGTATAYAVSSNSNFASLAFLDKQVIAFTPHITNGANGTSLNVDGLGVKPILSAPGVGLQGGVLIQGTPYVAVYNNSDAAFYLHGFFGNPYNIPLAGGLDYWAPTAPNSSFAFPIGQAVSRTGATAPLFALIGTTYGAGDGSTTFNLPNKSGRVSAALDPTGGILTGFSMSPNGNTLGGAGGVQFSQLTTANLPPYTPSGAVGVSVSGSVGLTVTSAFQGGSGGVGFTTGGSTPISASGSGSFSGNAQGGSSALFGNVQPTILCNYILRII
jgi:microcystin-dependent protein